MIPFSFECLTLFLATLISQLWWPYAKRTIRADNATKLFQWSLKTISFHLSLCLSVCLCARTRRIHFNKNVENFKEMGHSSAGTKLLASNMIQISFPICLAIGIFFLNVHHLSPPLKKKINWTESSAELLEDNFSFGIPRGRWEMRNTDNILNRFDLLLAGFCSVARRWRHHGVAIATDTYNSHRSAIDTRGFRKEKRKKWRQPSWLLVVPHVALHHLPPEFPSAKGPLPLLSVYVVTSLAETPPATSDANPSLNSYTSHLSWCVVLDACANGCQQMTCAEKEQQQTKTRWKEKHCYRTTL